MPVYTNPIIDQEPSPKVVFYVDNKCAIFTCNASPEGVILANTGSIAISDNGNIYKKSTDDLTTGWQQIITNTGQIVGIPRSIEVNLNAVGNVGAGLDTLHTFSLPANSLANDEDFIQVRYAGIFATNDNNKLISISFGGQNVHLTGSLDIDAGQWVYDILYVRVSATSIRASLIGLWRFVFVDGASAILAGSNGLFEGDTVTITVSDLNANAQTMLVQATGVADNDIVQNLSVIQLTQNT